MDINSIKGNVQYNLQKKFNSLKWKCNIHYHGTFENRSKSKKVMCMILAGYKDIIFPTIIKRVQMFAPKYMDICICTSGKYVPKIARLCRENGWSYLSTKENDVNLVQNVAINNHPYAKYIFKIDEDIFITKDFFDNMLVSYAHSKFGTKTQKDAFKYLGISNVNGKVVNPDFDIVEYNPGAIAPLIPVNGYGNMRILRKLDLVGKYEELFGILPKFEAGVHTEIEADPDVAKFFWGEGGYVPSIDDINAKFSVDPLHENACPIRFSFGAIMYERELWINMGGFTVVPGKNRLGRDEEQFNAYCINASRPIMISENIVVGHLAFSGQNEEMLRYFDKNKEIFEP